MCGFSQRHRGDAVGLRPLGRRRQRRVDQFGSAPAIGNPARPRVPPAQGSSGREHPGAYVLFDDGTVVPLGSATNLGSFPACLEPVTGLAARSDLSGYWAVSPAGVLRAAGSATIVGGPYIVAAVGGVARLSFTSASPGTPRIAAYVLGAAGV